MSHLIAIVGILSFFSIFLGIISLLNHSNALYQIKQNIAFIEKIKPQLILHLQDVPVISSFGGEKRAFITFQRCDLCATENELFIFPKIKNTYLHAYPPMLTITKENGQRYIFYKAKYKITRFNLHSLKGHVYINFEKPPFTTMEIKLVGLTETDKLALRFLE